MFSRERKALKWTFYLDKTWKRTPAEQEIVSGSNYSYYYFHSKSHNVIMIFVTVSKPTEFHTHCWGLFIFICLWQCESGTALQHQPFQSCHTKKVCAEWICLELLPLEVIHEWTGCVRGQQQLRWWCTKHNHFCKKAEFLLWTKNWLILLPEGKAPFKKLHSSFSRDKVSQLPHDNVFFY